MVVVSADVFRMRLAGMQTRAEAADAASRKPREGGMAMGRELILQTNAQQKHLVDPLLQMRRRALKRADAFKEAQAREDGDEDGEAGGANEAYAFLPQVPSLGTPLSFSPCRTR